MTRGLTGDGPDAGRGRSRAPAERVIASPLDQTFVVDCSWDLELGIWDLLGIPARRPKLTKAAIVASKARRRSRQALALDPTAAVPSA